MLAYNLDYLQDYDYAANQTDLEKLNDALDVLGDNNTNNGEVRFVSENQIEIYNSSGTRVQNWTSPDVEDLLGSEAYILALGLLNHNDISSISNANELARIQRLAKFIHLKEQAARDRKFGFANVEFTGSMTDMMNRYQYSLQQIGIGSAGDFVFSNQNYDTDGGDVAFANTIQGGRTEANNTASQDIEHLNLNCDFTPTTGNNYFGFGAPTDVAKEQRFIRLATSLCPTRSKFPSLFYLFPVADHAQDGVVSATASANGARSFSQSSQEYVAQDYVFKRSTSSGVNWDSNNDLYRVLVDSNNNDLDDVDSDGRSEGIDEIALTPKLLSTWNLPTDTAGTNEITTPSGTSSYIPFLDKGMFNGRQLMAVRTLDVDLDLLRNNSVSGETWIPETGIVYAFREDAVREDGIARPARTTWANCNTEANLTGSANCRMNVDTPRDPPVNADTKISPKPVDFVADPGRRPHGFRLSNGASLGRFGTNRGLSFISDNPVYINGDFNLHTEEEFTESLNSNWNNFYSREELNTRLACGEDTTKESRCFAEPINGDAWRPAEILSDAITVLSNNFCDGTIESGIRENNNTTVSSCSGSTSSFLNTTLDGDNVNWILEDGLTAPTNNTPSPVPIRVTRNGALFVQGSSTPYNTYRGMNDGRPLNDANETTVNTVFVSGITPARTNDSYGGLHNYPRFNETWEDDNLNISGSFIQLNFSAYDTANFDQQNAFVPAATATSDENIQYYRPPDRRWGFDVGLLYNPPGPVAARLFSTSTNRSETYEELASDDPYIRNLRCAEVGSKQVDPNAVCE